MSKIIEVDSRIADADRLLSQWERANVPTQIVKEMLPALLSPSAAVREAAGQWLTSHASVGLGIGADEAEAREIRQIQVAAREVMQRVRAESPEAVPSVPGFHERFHASDEALNARADEAMHSPEYPGQSGNVERLAASAESDDEMLARWRS